MRVLDRSVVGQLLDPLELIKATAMADLSAGRASVPPRIVARVDQLGLLAAMPAYSQSLNVLAAKQLTAGPYAQPGAYPPPQVSYPAPPPGATPPVIPAQRRAPEVDQKRPPEKREKKATGKILLAGSLGLLLGLLIGAALPRSTTGAAATSGTTKSAAGGTSAQSIDSAQAAPPAPLQAPVPAGTTDAAPVTPAGPLTKLGPGTYEVGTGDGQAMPGTYKSPGPDGSNIAGCYYSRLKHNDGSLGDILSNNVSEGPSVFTLKPSDGYVEIRGCTFTKS